MAVVGSDEFPLLVSSGELIKEWRSFVRLCCKAGTSRTSIGNREGTRSLTATAEPTGAFAGRAVAARRRVPRIVPHPAEHS